MTYAILTHGGAASPSRFADGCDEPALHHAGFSFGRNLAVNQTRPLSSNIGLWMLVWLSQIGLSPQ